MNLAIISDEIDQDISKVIAAVKECNFKGVEVRSVWNTRPDSLSMEQLDSIRTRLIEEDLKITGFDSPVFKTELPTEDSKIEQARKEFIHAVNQARRLNSTFLRVFTFYRKGNPNPILAGKIINEIISDIVPNDIEILFETGMKTNTPSMEHMLIFLNQTYNRDLGVVWDPGNSVFAGINPTPFPSDYLLGKDVIKHIHVKDPLGQTEYVPIGKGDIPWRELINYVLDDGYKGWFSLETHWRKGRVLSQELRDNPWFDEFSFGGYEASKESMKELYAYLRYLK